MVGGGVYFLPFTSKKMHQCKKIKMDNSSQTCTRRYHSVNWQSIINYCNEEKVTIIGAYPRKRLKCKKCVLGEFCIYCSSLKCIHCGRLLIYCNLCQDLFAYSSGYAKRHCVATSHKIKNFGNLRKDEEALLLNINIDN